MSKTPTNLVIRVSTPQMVQLPGVPAIKDAKGVTKEPAFRPQQLVPGQNDVPKSHWDRVKDNRAINLWLACGVLENRGEGKAVPIQDTIDDLDEGAAVKMIAATTRIDLLNTWKAATKNPKLTAAIDEQIAEIVDGTSGDAAKK